MEIDLLIHVKKNSVRFKTSEEKKYFRVVVYDIQYISSHSC